jgi:hypothetical protein
MNMSIHEYLWNTRVTVANILHHARLVSEGWTCRRIIGGAARKRRILSKLRKQ